MNDRINKLKDERILKRKRFGVTILPSIFFGTEDTISSMIVIFS
jgi:hypothetical protein